MFDLLVEILSRTILWNYQPVELMEIGLATVWVPGISNDV